MSEKDGSMNKSYPSKNNMKTTLKKFNAGVFSLYAGLIMIVPIFLSLFMGRSFYPTIRVGVDTSISIYFLLLIVSIIGLLKNHSYSRFGFSVNAFLLGVFVFSKTIMIPAIRDKASYAFSVKDGIIETSIAEPGVNALIALNFEQLSSIIQLF